MKIITNKDVIKGWSKAPLELLENFGDGDFARIHLLNPAIRKLLGDVRGRKILDAGCGQGYLCRMLARKGAIMTGVEPAEDFINYAIQREEKENLGITYIKEDLSKFINSPDTFDCVVCNMVFMDIPEYESAIRNCIKALKRDGNFIFSLSHPCFEDIGDEWKERKQVVVKEYLGEYEIKRRFGYSFHRPLSKYVNFVVQEGCRIKEILEPQLDKDLVRQYPEYERDAYVPSFIVIHAAKNNH